MEGEIRHTLDAMSEQPVSVVLPAFNEAATLAEDLAAIREAFSGTGIAYELIVVDDGSTDETASIAAGMPDVRLIQHEFNRGVGAARMTGIRAAEHEWIVTTDTDGTYPNHEMPRLVRLLADYDMVIGARTGSNVARSWIRAPIKWLIRMLASYLAQRRIPDLNSGLRAFRKTEALKFFYLLPESHSWESTITLAFLTNRRRVKFVSVDYYQRRGGRSSFHPLVDTNNYLQLVIRTIMYFRPLRIFLPLSLIIFAVGAIKTISDWIIFRDIGGADVIIILFAIVIAVAGLLADLMVVLHRKQDAAEDLHP